MFILVSELLVYNVNRKLFDVYWNQYWIYRLLSPISDVQFELMQNQSIYIILSISYLF